MLTCWFHLGLGQPGRALAALENVRAQLDSTALWDVFTGTAHGVAGRAEAAHEALGYAPQTSIEAGIERFVDWLTNTK